PDTFWSFKHALKFVNKKSGSPLLGLLTVAAMLPNGWNLRLVDLNVENLAEDDLVWADYVFLSAMAVQRQSAQKVINLCENAGVKIVAGGPLFSMEHERFSDVDHFVLNEAEETLEPFLSDLEMGRARNLYETKKFPDIHQTPAPLWQLANLKNYNTVSIQFSRGCPFNCDFCNVTALLGHTPRTKTAQQIIAELDGIYDLGWRKSIFFVDDNFIGNKKFLKDHLLPALIRWRSDKKGCVFFTESSINLADDPELLTMMVKAGFDSVFIGIESPDETALSECHKVQNKNRDLLESVAIIHRSGLQVMGGFIVGFDSDPPSIFQRQIDFIQKSGIVMAMVGMLQAPPGTRLFDRLQRQSRVVKPFTGDNVDGTTNILPQMGMESLSKGYQLIMKQIYSPANYYRRVRTQLRALKPPEVFQPLDIQRFLSFFRAGLRLGILGKERFCYWQLILWTLVRRPRLISVAVTLSIYGYHYRKICERYIF
ncbi:MAG TPA: B12-binding domain-containing radical SAM protein, partial [Desulfobacter sp.]|nr:B12-binding domain-containing radical SAM protein [Desulfobacter sp.]